ncbi:MAG: hypothetical protein KBG83_00195 [Bacteroidetes bacterium]|nr:hypothetical protein [Bacteroidota bacterium]
MPITIDEVQAADLINTGRTKWNNNDTTLKNAVNSLESQQAAHVGEGHPTLYYNKSEIDGKISTEATYRGAQDALLEGEITDCNDALTGHKSSGDHDAHNDGRYISSSILSDLVRKTLDQIIDGVKIFVQNIIIRKSNPKITMKFPDNSDAMEIYGTDGYEYGIKTRHGGGSLNTNFKITSNRIDFPNHDVYSKDSKVITESALSGDDSIVRTSGDQTIQGVKDFQMITVDDQVTLLDNEGNPKVILQYFDSKFQILQKFGTQWLCVFDSQDGLLNFGTRMLYTVGGRILVESEIDEKLQSLVQMPNVYYFQLEKMFSTYSSFNAIPSLYFKQRTKLRSIELNIEKSDDTVPLAASYDVNEYFPMINGGQSDLREFFRLVFYIDSNGYLTLTLHKGIYLGDTMNWSQLSSIQTGYTFQLSTTYYIGIKLITSL